MEYPSIASLKLFLRLAELEHVTLVAKESAISQSALSRRIAQLEDIFGAALFHRGPRGIRLSAFGAELRDEAKHIVHLAEHVVHSAKLRACQQERAVRIGASATTGAYLLPLFLKDLLADSHSLEVLFEESTSDVLEDKVLRGDLDLALVAKQPEYEELTAQLLWQESCALVAAPGRALPVHCGTVALPELVGLPLALLKKPNVLPDLQRALALLGSEARVRVLSENFATLRHVVEHDLAVAVVPQISARSLQWAARVYDLRGLDYRRKVFLVHRGRKALSASKAQVVDRLTAWVHDHLAVHPLARD